MTLVETSLAKAQSFPHTITSYRGDIAGKASVSFTEDEIRQLTKTHEQLMGRVLQWIEDHDELKRLFGVLSPDEQGLALATIAAFGTEPPQQPPTLIILANNTTFRGIAQKFQKTPGPLEKLIDPLFKAMGDRSVITIDEEKFGNLADHVASFAAYFATRKFSKNHAIEDQIGFQARCKVVLFSALRILAQAGFFESSS